MCLCIDNFKASILQTLTWISYNNEEEYLRSIIIKTTVVTKRRKTKTKIKIKTILKIKTTITIIIIII